MLSGSANLVKTAACIFPVTGAGILPVSSVDSCSFVNVPLNRRTIARLSKFPLFLPRKFDIIRRATKAVIAAFIIISLGKNKSSDLSIKLSTVLVDGETLEPKGNDGTGSISCFPRYETGGPGGIGSRVSSEHERHTII